MQIKKTIWLSSPKATFSVDVDEDNIIIRTAPICWQWKYKPLEDLLEAFHIDTVLFIDYSKKGEEK